MKAFAIIKIPRTIHERLKLESARTHKQMREIAIAALDNALPKKIAVVIGRDVPTKQRRVASA